MDQKKSLIITAIVGVLILAIIAGTIFYLIRFITSRNQATTPPTVFPTASGTPGLPSIPVITIATPSASPVSTPSVGQNSQGQVAGGTQSGTQFNMTKGGISTGAKSYSGNGFSLDYPQNWGLLTCQNSQNIEFDPNNSTDQQVTSCSRAIKPITLIVRDSAMCAGTVQTIGNVNVRKSVDKDDISTHYTWCTQTTPSLEFSTRVSSNPRSNAYTKENFSSEIEQIIATLKF